MKEKIHIMAIGAHAGDMELTCGGILTKYAMQGHKVTLLHLTAGEKGYPILSDTEYRAQKIKEANAFAKMIGANAMILDYKDGELNDDDATKFKVCDIIREQKPDVIITHWKNSIHKDHEATYRIVRDAVYYADIKSFERGFPPHSIQGLYFAENWEDPYDFKPYIYVDITLSYEKWLEAVKCYEFVVKSPYFRYLEYYSALSTLRGCECGKAHAEAFAIDPFGIKQIYEYFPVR